MKLKNNGAEIFAFDGKPAADAIKRTTHMAISAHQDDIEIMAADGILKCFGKENEWFFAVVVTNGAGSPRDDLYAAYSDEEMRKVRKLEQKKAAFIGEYGAAALLDYPNAAVKDPEDREIIEELKELVSLARPRTVYTHNLADKHDTHIGVVTKVIRALRELPPEVRPERVYGCEVWRSLDWVNDGEKVAFDVSAHPNISAALVEVFDSQVCGGKRYDLATVGRRLGNATYSASHGVDEASSVSFAVDLTPLVADPSLDIAGYIRGFIDRFAADVTERIGKVL